MKKKRILINGRFTSHHFAIKNFIFNVTKQICEDPNYDVYIILNKDSDISRFKELDVKILRNPLPADSAGVNHLFAMFLLPWIMLFKRISLVVYPQISLYLFNPCKTILYMHDLIEYHVDSQKQSKLAFRKKAYPYVCKHADLIMTVSQSTKNDIIDFFNIPENKIVVNYCGTNDNIFPVDKKEARKYIFDKYGVSEFVFYIGYLTHPQKNLVYLIDEFKKFYDESHNGMLVFAGPKGKDADYILEHSKLLGDNFKYIGKVPYEDINKLLSASEIFCFPSLFEGFGMPVLEAMGCGTVVFSSNISSIPEILAEPRFLINPREEGALYQKLKEYYGKDNTEIIASNLQRAKLFTWPKHGEMLRDVIHRVLK